MGDVKRYAMDENSLMGGTDMFEDDDGDYVLHSDYATLLARHNALVEAVKDERFAEAQLSECWTSERERALKSARAEADRLIATDDCEGEG